LHYITKDYLKKLAAFRERDVPDACVLNYFDENEVPVKNFDVESGDVLEFMTRVIGKQRNYGPSKEEIETTRQEVLLLKVIQDSSILIGRKCRMTHSQSKKRRGSTRKKLARTHKSSIGNER